MFKARRGRARVAFARGARGGCFLISAVLAAACTPIDQTGGLDHDAGELIRQVRSDHLGTDSAADVVPGQVEADETVRGDAYQVRPPTENPPAGALPAWSGKDQPGAAAAERGTGDQVALLLDLDGALGYAIRNAREYQTRKEALFRTALDFLAERHLWGPRLFDSVTSEFTGTPESGDHDQAHRVIHELRVTQRLPYGGEVSVAALVELVHQLRQSAKGAAGSGQDASVQLGLTLPLLRGGGVEAREDLIQAEREVVYAVRSFERFRREFLVNVASRYYDLLRQQSGIRNVRHQVENLEWLSRRVRALAEAGREPYFEVQRAEAQVLFARNSLLNAQEDYADALDAFKVEVGMSVGEEVGLSGAELAVPEPARDQAGSVQEALALRLDLQTSRDRVGDAYRKRNVARRELLPDLDVFADAEVPTDPDQRYGGVDLDAGAGSYTAGVTLGVPLDRRLERVRYRQSLIDLEAARRGYALDRDRVAQEVRRAIRRLEQAESTLTLQNRNIEVARRRLRGVVLRLHTLGPRDFIEAQEDLLDALNGRDEARRDLRVTVLEYLLATGQMRVAADGRWQGPAIMTKDHDDGDDDDGAAADAPGADKGSGGGAPSVPGLE